MQPIFRISDMRGYRAQVELLQNPFVCDCDFYEVESLLYSVNKVSKNNRLECVNESANNNSLVCNHLQEVHAETLNLSISKIEKYVFPKVKMRISAKELIVRTTVPLKFRLWMLKHRPTATEMNSKCPTGEWIRESDRCLLLPREENIISLDNYVEPNILSTICVILQSEPKRVWPLHYQTIRINENEGSEWIIVESIVWIVGCLFEIFINYLIVNCKRLIQSEPNGNQEG